MQQALAVSAGAQWTIAFAFTFLALAGTALVAQHAPRTERSEDDPGRGARWTVLGVAVAAILAAAFGEPFGPTGVPTLDSVLTVMFVVLVSVGFEGVGVGASFGAIGAPASASVFALLGFAHQDRAATAAAALTAFFLATIFWVPGRGPARLSAARLASGAALAVLALNANLGDDPWRNLVTPPIVLGLALLAGAFRLPNAFQRQGARGPSTTPTSRLAARAGSAASAVVGGAALILAGLALFVGRAVLDAGMGAMVAAAVVLVVALLSPRTEPKPARNRRRRTIVGWSIVAIVAVLAISLVPLALVARDATHAMQDGREEATTGLSTARDGDTPGALDNFERAADAFEDARGKLTVARTAGGLAVPFVAGNVRAARELADLGTDLTHAATRLARAANADELDVVDGRVPIETVRKLTPELESSAAAVTDALTRLDDLRDEPYLLSPVRRAVNRAYEELRRAGGEARRGALAARLSPGILGADGPRRYLLVAQNNAESRPTGGFIGSFGAITAEDGKLSVGDIQRARVWNAAVRALADPTIEAPADYLRRYGLYLPQTTLQNINLSPDFPSVAEALMSLAPQAGLGEFDGVLSVDPVGLAALLELTGPVEVPGWPEPITDDNVVDVTLRDAYAAYPDTPDRADLLGDVARAAVDQATSTDLGKPAEIAKVLGAAAHEGHITLAFARPEEQRMAEQLGVAQRVDPIRSDAIALTTSNFSGTKLDYYLERTLRYAVRLEPNDSGTRAIASAAVGVSLFNNAPPFGLPEGVLGPFDNSRFRAGQDRLLVSVYSPLLETSSTVNGTATNIANERERGRNVYSVFTDVYPQQTSEISMELQGIVELHDGWYTLSVRHQPTLTPDRFELDVEVADGWHVVDVSNVHQRSERTAGTTTESTRDTVYRVRIERDAGSSDLWSRLEAGG